MAKLADVETQTKVRCGVVAGKPVEILHERTDTQDLVYVTIGEHDGQHVTMALSDFMGVVDKVHKGLLLLAPGKH